MSDRKRSKQPNARFWVWANDAPVKLTLRPGQSVSCTEGGPCEEGYSYEHNTWSLDGGAVLRRVERDARDCDGRVKEERYSMCAVAALGDYFYEVPLPVWTELPGGYMRDYAAEAMGY